MRRSVALLALVAMLALVIAVPVMASQGVQGTKNCSSQVRLASSTSGSPGGTLYVSNGLERSWTTAGTHSWLTPNMSSDWEMSALEST